MSRYLLLFRSHEDTFDTLTKDEVEHFNGLWRDWWEQGSSEGWMVEASRALRTEGWVLDADGTVTPGPLVDRSDVARGYVDVEAGSLDAAVELARGCPVLHHGGRVEVRPFFDTHPGD